MTDKERIEQLEAEVQALHHDKLLWARRYVHLEEDWRQLEARKKELVEALRQAIHELECSGYCYDHPSLEKKRAVLARAEAARKEGE